MPTITLSEAEQIALRSLMLIEPTPGRPVPSPQVLRLIERLVPCDALGVAVVDSLGTGLEEVVLSRSHVDRFSDEGDREPGAEAGMTRARRDRAEAYGVLDGVQDRVVVQVRNGRDGVSELWFDRRRRDFKDTELARIALITPLVQRLLRQHLTARVPAAVTLQERRVLVLVATGMSNAEIAAQLFLSVGTVRKHLEHAYRKLGVHNRMAAVLALSDSAGARPDHLVTTDEYA
jgi:DNA-binding CsgD family transcriptional regulator